MNNYLAEIGRRVSMYGRNSINGSIEWLSVPFFGCNDAPPWTENILVTILHWVVEVTSEMVVTAVLTSFGVDPSLPVRLTFPGLRKCVRHCAPRP